MFNIFKKKKGKFIDKRRAITRDDIISAILIADHRMNEGEMGPEYNLILAIADEILKLNPQRRGYAFDDQFGGVIKPLSIVNVIHERGLR